MNRSAGVVFVFKRGQVERLHQLFNAVADHKINS